MRNVVLIKFPFAGQVAFGFCHNDAGQGNQGNQVRDGHEAVYDIGQNPDGFEFEETAAGNQCNEDYAVGHDPFGTEEIDAGALAVVVPAQDSGEGEEHECDSQEAAAHSTVSRSKGGARHGGTSGITLPYAREDESQACHGADNQSVDKGTRHGDKTLFSRFLGLGGSCGNGRRTEAGFVGEHAAGDTILHGHHNGGTSKSADCCRTGKSGFKNQSDSGGNAIKIHGDKPHADGDIHDRHKGNDLGGNFGNALQATDGDGGNQNREYSTCEHLGQAKGNFRTIHNGVDLREGADTEICYEDGGSGEERSQRLILFAHALTDVVHGATGDIALGIRAAVLNGQQAFGVLGSHAEEGGHPHPEDSAGATDFHSCCHADDITCADCSSQCHTKGLEAGNIAFAVILGFENQGESLGQAYNLQKFQAQGQVDACAHQQGNQRRPPHEGVDGIKHRDK